METKLRIEIYDLTVLGNSIKVYEDKRHAMQTVNRIFNIYNLN